MFFRHPEQLSKQRREYLRKSEGIRHYKRVVIDLGVARDKVEFDYFGESILVAYIDGYCDIYLNDDEEDYIDLEVVKQINMTFWRFRLTNTAQAGKKAIIYISIHGIFNISKRETVSIGSTSGITGHTFGMGGEETVLTKLGRGYSDYTWCNVLFKADSHFARILIYCDGKLAFDWSFFGLEDYGFDAHTDRQALLYYAVDGDCAMLITQRFEFQEKFEIKGMANGQTINVETRWHLAT